MFKLIGIFTLITVAAARPGLLEARTSLETIGSIVNHIPTAITHQSKTEIHNQQQLISSIVSPVLTSIPAQSIVQDSGSILSAPIISSQIQSSGLLEDQEQSLRGSIIGEQDSLLNDQTAILQNQESLIGGQNIIVAGQRGLVENGASIINDQNAILQNQGSVIGGQSIIVGGQNGLIENGASISDQNAIVGNSGLLADSISSSRLQLNGLNGLSQ